ncbi:hypothetical protein PXK00_00130 [Phaeobacter sp. QD34_3]|uniref:hypothetical protein n=1 Tax=unclassified Phaeobacter TaxID=2621772 RepID=UPI00237F4148|nr:MULTISPECIES: hypothetical protein [unclassified Phaeobacter]MDE4131500.1 hypothetical protein [Phaeobacter sp. QD34_3]MDE4135411.1 hypothetical protein [Phaeobacter sp. QD34_24]
MGKRSLLLALTTCLHGAWSGFSAEAAPVPIPALAAPEQPLKVFHLGHSLVGPVMPHMLAQLAPDGHSWNSQLGSGTSLKEHWEPDAPIRDFDLVNQAPIWRDAKEAIGSGEYDAVVLTEMVELRDAVKYFGSAKYLRRWARLARAASPDARIYLYETWHHLDDPDGWQARIDADLERLWLGKVLGSDSRRNPKRPVYLIPAGQVLAAVAGAINAGKVEGVADISELFAKTPDGLQDTIHINDLGAYVVALTHYAVLYHRSPVGLPHELSRPDGGAAEAFSARAAKTLQEIVWQVVQSLPRTGLAQAALIQAGTIQAGTIQAGQD